MLLSVCAWGAGAVVMRAASGLARLCQPAPQLSRKSVRAMGGNDARKQHPDLIAFIEALTRLEHTLAGHKNATWARKLAHVRGIAERNDGHCLVAFQRLLGGMGSLSDLVLTSPADNRVFAQEFRRVCRLARALSG